VSTEQKKQKRKQYPSDMSENGWKKFKQAMPIVKSASKSGGRPAADIREVINAILYVVKTGGSWRSLPHDFPCWQTVYGYKCLLRYIRRSFNLRELSSHLKLVWVDGGYRGSDLKNFVQKLWGWCWQVVLRTDEKKGFKILPRRWVVERTFAWILHARRLSVDYEKNRVNAQSMLYLAMITIMLKRL